MGMSGRILMLTSTWDSEYSNAMIAGILDRIGDRDYELHIFNAYDGLLESGYFSKGREVYSLPDPTRYDGLLIALSTVESVKYVSGITQKFHEYNKPIVGIDTHAENAIFCGLDNYRSMYQLVEHMITIHDCRTLNYLGGPEDNSENMERYKAFCDCLEAHGIKVQRKRVLHKRFIKPDGVEAYNEWKEMGVHMADAVICANDFMALGYVDAATRDGISIPDYMKVTGFDNIVEAQKYSPSITSVNRNWKSLGYEATDALFEALDGATEYDTRYVEGYTVFNESCGCDLSRDIGSDYNELVKRSKKDQEVATRHSYTRQLLLQSRTIEEYEAALSRAKEFLEIEDVAVCLNRTFFDGDPDLKKVGYDDDITIYTDEGSEQIDSRERIFPPKWKGKYKAYVFASLRSSDQTFGYTVIPYTSDFFTRLKHSVFVESLSISVESVNQRIAIEKLKEKLTKTEK